ncbi:MAG: hypothetical protein ACOYT9_00795 [Patescibacteria group bacterium]
MTREFEILQEVKHSFGWPVDCWRYTRIEYPRYIGNESSTNELDESLQKKVRYSLAKIDAARKVLKWLTYLPWVRMLFITGSVASLNAEPQDDIDVWIIVNPRRIWLTRAIDFFLYTLIGKRRLARDGVEESRVNDKLCFNFYSTLDSLHLKKETASYAMQFVDAIPLYIKDIGEYRLLLEQNQWIEKYFPTWYTRNLEVIKNATSASHKKSVWDVFFDALDYIAGVLMIAKAERQLTFSPAKVFRSEFTTWGTPRILSRYDDETFTKSGQKDQ